MPVGLGFEHRGHHRFELALDTCGLKHNDRFGRSRVEGKIAHHQPHIFRLCGEDFLHLGKEGAAGRSEEHTSELQSLMRISYAVFCLKKKTKHTDYTTL